MAVIATGFFDGLHPGHRLVIDTLLSEAQKRGEQSIVITFWPHPRAVLQSGADSLRYLSSRSQRDSMLRSLGVDEVQTVAFTREFASRSAEEYLKMLCRDYQCSCLVLGYDTRFGAEQAGPSEIGALCSRMGIDYVVTPPFEVDGLMVFRAVNAGEKEAIESLTKFTRGIAVQIFNLQTILDSERIAIGGGISAQPVLIEYIRRHLNQLYSDCPYRIPRAEIVTCKFQNDANLYGAMQCYLENVRM